MYIDIAIILALIYFMSNGYRKGFVKSIYSVISLAATIFLLFVLKDTFIEAISSSDIGKTIGEFISQTTDNALLVKKCSEAAIYFVSCIVLYIAIKIALKFLLKILNALSSLPIISFINKFLGLIIGTVFGAIWIVIIINILYIFPQTSQYVVDSFIANYFGIIFI